MRRVIFGTETEGDLKNVSVTNCVMLKSASEKGPYEAISIRRVDAHVSDHDGPCFIWLVGILQRDCRTADQKGRPEVPLHVPHLSVSADPRPEWGFRSNVNAIPG
jgi:hypothetical protein